MATTAIIKNGTRLLFMTVQRSDGNVDVDIFTADKDFLPQGKPSIGVAYKNEIDYHKELRAKAEEHGDLVKDFCTNPEWNP